MWWIVICYLYEIFSFSSFILLTVVARNDIERQGIIRMLSRLQLYTAAKTIARSLWTLFFYTYSRKQMSRETSTNASASICTIHIFRRVTDRFCYFPLLSLFLSLFFFCNTSYYSYNECEKEKVTERRREIGVTRKEARYYWSTLSRRMS